MNVWVVGNDGTILTTTDGGAWRSQDAGTSHHLAGVAFADADHGWIVGLTRESAIIIATTDGGRHWQTQLAPPQIRLFAVACIGRDLVWAAGDRGDLDGLILASSDGGASWQEQLAPVGRRVRDIAFADALRGWATTVDGDDGWAGHLLHTTDGGRSWQSRKRVEMRIEGIALQGPDLCWAAGTGRLSGHSVQARLLVADRSGVTWKDAPSGSTFLRGATALPDGGIGVFALGMARPHLIGAVLWSSSDSGESWRPVLMDAGINPDAVVFADSLHGWAVGLGGRGEKSHPNHGVILQSDDGGLSWRRSHSHRHTPQLRDIACVPTPEPASQPTNSAARNPNPASAG